MSSEHVEVLWAMLRKCVYERLARKSADREADALAAAIAALSAPQPPAEAQRCTCPSGDGSLRWPCPAHPPESQAQVVQEAAIAHQPVAPVGVEGLPERWRREAPQAKVDSGEDAARAYREAMHWCAFQLEEALAQQPAAVFRNDGNSEADFIADDAIACTACGGSGHRDDQQPAAVDSEMVTRAVNAYDEATGEGWQMPCLQGMRAALTAALAAQQGGES